MSDPKKLKLNDELVCGVCHNSYTTPKLLQCFHAFCKKCLETLVVHDQHGLSLDCPECKYSTLLPPNSVSGLQAAFHIEHHFDIQSTLEKLKVSQKLQCEKCKKGDVTSYCCTCGKFICSKCTEIHSEWEELYFHEVVGTDQVTANVAQLVSPKKKVMYCPKHNGKELDIYCETCEELICLHCTVRLHQREEGHKFDLVSDVFSKHKDELVSCLKPVEEQLSFAAKFTESLGILTDQEAAIEADIRENIRQLHEALEVRESELIGQLGQMTQQKLKTLETQRPQLELIQARLNSCHDFVNKSLQTGNQAEILKMKKPIMKQIKQTIAESADFKPETEDMKFVTADLTQMVQQFGQIYSHSVHPENCYATGKGLEVAVAQKHNTVTLHIIDAKGQACEEPLPLAAISCELDSVSHIKCAKKEGNKYELSYQPTRRGQHQLHVRVEGKHIKGSPFPVTTVKSLTTPTGSIKDLQKPYGITVNQSGQIMVTERHHISVFNPNGEKYKTFGECGSDDGQFMFPHGVAMDRNGNILVADGRNHRIQKLTADGSVTRISWQKGQATF